MKNITLITLLFVVTQNVMAQELIPFKGGAANNVARDQRDVPVLRLNAFESDSLRISLNDSLSGFVEGKVCDACEKIKVTITPDTKAFNNRVEVPLKRAANRLGRYATVIFDENTKKASQIRW